MLYRWRCETDRLLEKICSSAKAHARQSHGGGLGKASGYTVIHITSNNVSPG